MTKKHLLRCLISVWLIACLLLSGCSTKSTAATTPETQTSSVETQAVPVETQTPSTEAQSLPTEAQMPSAEIQALSVAVYPYIPDMELFRQVLTRQWEALEPDVELTFIDWDCYLEPDPVQIDVMTYDALFTSYLAENGYIQPIHAEDLVDREGILPFAVDGAYHNNQLYGVPYLVCSYFLIHRSDDAELAQVQNVSQLCSVLDARKQQDSTAGLLMNYNGDYPYHYLDALIDFSGSYTVYDELPSRQPDPAAYQILCQLKQSLAPEQENAEYLELRTFRRGALFNSGYGSAYFGYSEDIHFMDDILENIMIRPISYSETENIQLFFADIASMGAHVTDPDHQALCIKLMNLIGSKEFQQELCFVTGDPQYMLPARESVYIRAQEEYPMYLRLHELVTDDGNRIFRFGKDVHTYLSTAYEDLAS